MTAEWQAVKKPANGHFLFKFKGRPVQVFVTELGGRDGGAAGPSQGVPLTHLRTWSRTSGGHLRQTTHSQGLWPSECFAFLSAEVILVS